MPCPDSWVVFRGVQRSPWIKYYAMAKRHSLVVKVRQPAWEWDPLFNWMSDDNPGQRRKSDIGERLSLRTVRTRQRLSPIQVWLTVFRELRHCATCTSTQAGPTQGTLQDILWLSM
jgi:hypothetical protein